jgi:DNA-binding transcriptional MocR family regulator
MQSILTEVSGLQQGRFEEKWTGMRIAVALGDWATGSGPLYVKLADALQAAIHDGRIRPGTRLPSERRLAEDLVVSRSTVVAAYERLRAEGAVASRHGSGTYVAGRSAAARRDLDHGAASPGAPVFRRLLAGAAGDDRLISFACATIPGSPAIAEAVATFPPADLAALLDDTGYLPSGLPALRRGLAELLCAEGLPTTASQVLVTTGAHQAVSLCASLLVRPGDVVVVERPTYPGCVDAFAAAGARFVALPVDGDGVVVDDLAAILDRQSVAALYLMPTYQNPTGALLAAHRRRRIAEVAGAAGVAVIEDNALCYARLGGPDAPPPIGAWAVEAGAPVISVGSLSKALWGGLRVGWLRAPEPWLSRLARRKVAADLGSALLDQAIAARLLDRLPELLAANTALLTERLASCAALLRARLPDWSWDPPTGGPSLWVRLPAGDAGRFAQVALRHGVEIIEGAHFTMDASFADHLRLPFTCEPTVMAEAVDRLARAWAVYAPEDRGEPSPRPRVQVAV